MNELIDKVRQAADQLDTGQFLELLRWHRAVAGMPDLDWTATGAYRRATRELGETRATELLHDVRRAARDPRSHRHGADGKPTFRGGRTLAARTKPGQ